MLTRFHHCLVQLLGSSGRASLPEALPYENWDALMCFSAERDGMVNWKIRKHPERLHDGRNAFVLETLKRQPSHFIRSIYKSWAGHVTPASFGFCLLKRPEMSLPGALAASASVVAVRPCVEMEKSRHPAQGWFLVFR